jgi:hypothetical protein
MENRPANPCYPGRRGNIGVRETVAALQHLRLVPPELNHNPFEANGLCGRLPYPSHRDAHRQDRALPEFILRQGQYGRHRASALQHPQHVDELPFGSALA